MNPFFNETATAIITAVIMYIVGYRKQKIENESNELTAVRTAITIWQDTAEDLKKDMEAIRRENRVLNIAVAKLTKALQKFDPDLANEINSDIAIYKKQTE